jgi:thymidine kinase
LPGKEYTYLVLKPLGLEAARGNRAPLLGELTLLADQVGDSALASEFRTKYRQENETSQMCLRVLDLPYLAEKALLYLYSEQNLISREDFIAMTHELNLNCGYLNARLLDAGRPAL